MPDRGRYLAHRSVAQSQPCHRGVLSLPGHCAGTAEIQNVPLFYSQATA
jgi:hypothetical protein